MYVCEKEILVRKFFFFKICVEYFLIIYEKVFLGIMILSNFYKINVFWLLNFSELYVLGKVMVIVIN